MSILPFPFRFLTPPAAPAAPHYRAADVRALHAMADHELADIGLHRADLPPLPGSLVLGDDWRSWHRFDA